MRPPIRSTRNKTINYAEYDTSYAVEADYDSDYVPPRSADFRKTAKSTKSVPAVSPVVRRSPRNNGSRTSSSTQSSK
jgi:hypothetical protein